jgi:MFS transporter, DHA1 family, multidrug resistance protein
MSVDAESVVTKRTSLILLLGLLSAFAPMAIDMYVPALPAVGAGLHVGESLAQLTLAVNVVGLAAGQLLIGSFSDIVGRRRLLLVGLAVFILVSVGCLLANSLPLLLVMRLLQGFSGACGPVLARAVVRDLYSGVEMARLFSLLTLSTTLAPVIAPLIGATVLRIGSWRDIFAVLAVLGLVLLVACAVMLPETLPADRRHSGGLGQTMRNYRTLLGDRVYRGYALTAGMLFATMFAYIAGAAFVLETVYSLSATTFSVIFGVNALGMAVMGQVNARLVRRTESRLLLRWVTAVVAAADVVLMVTGLLHAPLFVLLIPMFVGIATLGMGLPNCTTLAMANYRSMAGSASALLGALQFTIAGVITPLVGLGGNGAVLTVMTVVMAVAALAGLATFSSAAAAARPAAA